MPENVDAASPLRVDVPARVEVALTQEKLASRTPDWERPARILSLVAIPVVLAVIGGVIQEKIGRSAVNRDYVQLAVTVLTADKTKTPQELRNWAVDLLNENSPTKFSPDVASRLKGGEIGFPGSIAEILSTANGDLGLAVSRDGRLMATVQDKEIGVWDVATGRSIHDLKGHTQRVNSVAFSPDATTLASGASDNTVRLWDVATGGPKSILSGLTEEVIGVAFTPDGHLLTRSLDGTVSFWDVSTGRLLRRMELGKRP